MQLVFSIAAGGLRKLSNTTRHCVMCSFIEPETAQSSQGLDIEGAL